MLFLCIFLKASDDLVKKKGIISQRKRPRQPQSLLKGCETPKEERLSGLSFVDASSAALSHHSCIMDRQEMNPAVEQFLFFFSYSL